MPADLLESPGVPPSQVSWRVYALAAALVAAEFLAYSNCWHVPFQFDDLDNIAQNESIRTLIVPPEVSLDHFRRRPVGRWSLWLNYRLGGLDVTGMHMLNVMIHVGATLALFGLVRRTLLLRQFDGRFEREADFLAFACAALWGLHPLQTQSVTYLIQRVEALMGLFCLLALYCLARSVNARRGWPWLAGMAGAISLSIGSKEVGMMALPAALLYDRVFVSMCWRELLRRHGLAYLATLPAAAWFVVAMRAVASGEVKFSRGTTPWEYFRSQPGVILHYLRLSFWPDVLVLDYNWPIAQTWPQIVLPGLVLMTLLVASLWALWRHPVFGFLGLSFFLVLAPSSSFMPILDLAYEHRMYLPLAPVVVLTVLGIWMLLVRLANPLQFAERVTLAAVLIASLALGWRTHLRNVDWANDLALWSANVRDRPESKRGWGNYSKALIDRGRAAEAVSVARRAVEIEPGDPWCHVMLGCALLQTGQIDDSFSEYQRALQLKPTSHYAQLGLAKCHLNLKQPELAAERFRQALTNEVASADAHDGLARVLVDLGRPDEAIPHFRAACDKDLLEPIFPLNFGSFYARRRQFGPACEQFAEAIRRKPDYAQAHLQLALARFESGDLRGASQAAVKLLRLKPDSQTGRELLRRIEAAQQDLLSEASS